MNVTAGEMELQVQQGKALASVRVWPHQREAGVWMWTSWRELPLERSAEAGKARTWAAAYRAGMRAAERLLAREVKP